MKTPPADDQSTSGPEVSGSQARNRADESNDVATARCQPEAGPESSVGQVQSTVAALTPPGLIEDQHNNPFLIGKLTIGSPTAACVNQKNCSRAAWSSCRTLVNGHPIKTIWSKSSKGKHEPQNPRIAASTRCHYPGDPGYDEIDCAAWHRRHIDRSTFYSRWLRCPPSRVSTACNARQACKSHCNRTDPSFWQQA
jgi:hypothetical protein